MKNIKKLTAALLVSAMFCSPCAQASGQELIEDAELLKGVGAVYALDEGSILVSTSARGIEGDVALDITMASDGSVEKITVVSHSETPALGGMALQEEYLNGYIGAVDTDEIDAYAGATVTSGAIKKCVDLAIMQYKSINGIEFEMPMTKEELTADALSEALGEKYESVECDGGEFVKAVYHSENGTAMLLEGYGHNEETPITLLVIFGNNNKVANVLVIDHAETEGIGTNALKDTYLWYYRGGSDFALIDIGFCYKIDVVGGATETSLAVFKMINSACTLLKTL